MANKIDNTPNMTDFPYPVLISIKWFDNYLTPIFRLKKLKKLAINASYF